MKLTSLLLLVASASALRLNDPAGAYNGRAENLKKGLEAVKKQGEFADKHFEAHTAAMDKADKECQTLKDSIRQAREDRITSSVVAPYKTWGSGGK